MSSPSGGSRVGSLLLHDGAIWTGLNSPKAQAMAIMDGVIVEVGTNQHILDKYGNSYQKEHIVNLCGRTVVPGLIDSHLHVIREGMHFNMELRWDGVKSLAQGLQMIKEQTKRTPKGQWIRVVGGWNEHQFIEKRLPTIAELDVAGGDHPVFVLHLYDCALVNRIGLSILGYTAQTPNPPSGEIERDEQGNPTGVLIARPNAFLLYNTLNMLPKLDHEQAKNSTLAYIRELHRFGVTSVLDPGGGFQNYPNDYKVIQELDSEEKLTLRIHYSLFPQKPKKELEDFQRWAKMVSPGQGSAFLRHLGAGEMLAFTAADFEDFKEARPDLPHDMESDLEEVVRFLVSVNWPFRLHATYGESIERELTVFEKIAKEENNMGRFKSLHWFIDHAETISQHEIARINALGGGIAIQHRMAFQGEYFIQRYGAEAASHAPPIHAIKQGGVPLGGGTDGTRVATYNPWISLYWLATGRTTGGTDLTSQSSTGTANKLSREEALHLWTHANTWFIKEEQTRGLLQPGYVADLTVLNTDFFSCSEDSMKSIESLLTIVNGRIVYAHPSIENEFNSSHVQPTPHPHVIPEWSPVNYFGGYQLHGSTAWKPVETTIISTTNDEYKTNPHQSLQQGSQSTINLVDPSKFFEHGHDC